MAFILLILFVSVPIIEIAVFIEVGGIIGLWWTIGIVILTAIIGTAMLRHQGISILFRIRENLEADRIPVREMFDGICLVVAGALLLTPGFFTDAVGFVLLIPPLRLVIAGAVARKIMENADVRFHAGTHPGPGPRHGPGVNPTAGAGNGPVIDGEFQEVPDPADPPEKPKRQIGDGST